jgi:hypothetical protein
MKILGLDGKYHKWNHACKRKVKSSKLHVAARELLHIIFPLCFIAEEVYLPGTKINRHKTLYADFYIHSERLLIEVHGEQHYKYNSFHYSDKLVFYKAQGRDHDKQRWCAVNDITYLELPHYESIEQWRKRILTRSNDGTEVAASREDA